MFAWIEWIKLIPFLRARSVVLTAPCGREGREVGKRLPWDKIREWVPEGGLDGLWASAVHLNEEGGAWICCRTLPIALCLSTHLPTLYPLGVCLVCLCHFKELAHMAVEARLG